MLGMSTNTSCVRNDETPKTTPVLEANLQLYRLQELPLFLLRAPPGTGEARKTTPGTGLAAIQDLHNAWGLCTTQLRSWMCTQSTHIVQTF